jgi:hypothetical protein
MTRSWKVKLWRFSRAFHRTSWKSHLMTGSKDASELPQIQGTILHASHKTQYLFYLCPSHRRPYGKLIGHPRESPSRLSIHISHSSSVLQTLWFHRSYRQADVWVIAEQIVFSPISRISVKLLMCQRRESSRMDKWRVTNPLDWVHPKILFDLSGIVDLYWRHISSDTNRRYSTFVKPCDAVMCGFSNPV